MASFFAQVWANGSNSEHPELWLTPPDFQMSWPQIIVPSLVDFTGTDPLGWLLGNAARSSASGSVGTAEDDRPPAEVVDAEAAYATGMVYLTRGAYVSGVEGALVASLLPASQHDGAS